MESKQMRRIRSFIAIGAFSLAVLALPTIVSAQRQGQNDAYWRGNNGNYGNIRGTVQNLQNRAKSFDRQVNRIDDRRDKRSDVNWNRDRDNRIDGLDRLATEF